MALAVTAFVVFVERGQRRITVNYAKRQQGRKMYAAQSTHLPLKLNMAGVIPPIFASSIILFPATLGSWFGSTEGYGLVADAAAGLSPGQPMYVYAVLCVGDHFLLFLLYRAGVQFEGDGGQPEEIRRLHPRDPSRASRPLATSTA
jgi:preprotein translocase subunit SecY